MTLPARKLFGTEPRGHTAPGQVVAFPVREAFGRAAPRRPFSLTVDLANEELGWRWCRGAATLAALCASVLALAPGIGFPLPGEPMPAPLAPGEMRQYESLAAAAAAAGGEALPAPLAPDKVAKPRGVGVGERHGLKRIAGDVTDGLYWSLRGAGASTETAALYLQAVATRIDVGEVAQSDRFDFVVDTRRGNALVYAALDRQWDQDVAVVRWPGPASAWLDAAATEQRSTVSGLMSPVAGRITSGFGSRTHPILRFTRFHAGIDFGAGMGTPIVAAADGQIIGAGWAGGYGRRVVVSHGSGIVTTYSHMSGFAASPGTPVRQGQVIGYVGSSGLSTGPHLHFEVRANGRAVNPLSVQLVQRPAISENQQRALKARVKQLTSIPLTTA